MDFERGFRHETVSDLERAVDEKVAALESLIMATEESATIEAFFAQGGEFDERLREELEQLGYASDVRTGVRQWHKLVGSTYEPQPMPPGVKDLVLERISTYLDDFLADHGPSNTERSEEEGT